MADDALGGEAVGWLTSLRSASSYSLRPYLDPGLDAVKNVVKRAKNVSNASHMAAGHSHRYIWLLPSGSRKALSKRDARSRESRLSPNGRFMNQWDILSALLLFYTATVTPYEVGFTVTRLNLMFYVNRLVDILFMADMVIQFNLPYTDAVGVLHSDYISIWQHYLKTWFLLDLVSVLPFDSLVIMMQDDSLSRLKALRLLRQVRLVKLLRMLRGGRVLQRFEKRNAINYAVLNFYKFIFLQIIVCHWMACALIILVSEEEGETWLSEYDFASNDSPAVRKYLVCLYTSMATITTLSYGDIFAITDSERVFVLFAMLVGAGTYAYIVGGVCEAVSAISHSSRKFNHTMDRLNAFLREKGIDEKDPELCTSLRDYSIFNYTHGHRTKHFNLVMAELTETLQGQIADEIHRPWLDKTTFFRNIDNGAFYMHISMCMKPFVRPVLEPIFFPNDQVDGLYVIDTGIVICKEVIYRKNRAFGFDALFRCHDGETWGYTAMPLSHVSAHMLPANDLSQILLRPEYAQIRCKVRKEVVRYQCSQIMMHVGEVMKKAVQQADFTAGYKLLKEEGMHQCNTLVWLFIVKLSSPSRLDHLLYAALQCQNVYRRARLNQRLRIYNAIQRRKLRNRAAAEDLEAIVGVLGYHHYIERLYEAGIDSGRLMSSCTGPELLAAGIPLGDVKRIQLNIPHDDILLAHRRMLMLHRVREDMCLKMGLAHT